MTRLTVTEFWRELRLVPDPFQLEACTAIWRDENVLVSAPTGSGKTAIAAYGVARSLSSGRGAVYTTPIKALSNQKFLELVASHGPERVGLVTGDVSVNPGADVVVMTTEVLRNIVYTDPARLDVVETVVLDEVHFLQDAYRGAVWEEVIIHLPPDIRLVALSATVSNATVVGDWISSVRGPTAVIEEWHRPVALTHFLAVDSPGEYEPTIVRLPSSGRASPEMVRALRRMEPTRRRPSDGRRKRQGRGPRPPDRCDVVRALQRRDMLPSIFFIFSRRGCAHAAATALRAGVDLTTDQEKATIIETAQRFVAAYSDGDLAVLEFLPFLAQLERGIGTHHAGMIPAFKEIVEYLFVRGLVKVVFATETLAVGINMPARSVVLDKVTKFESAGHRVLRPSEYAQLTGRAGRRGLDEQGAAVTLWSPFVSVDQIGGLVRSRRFDLHSSFRPTYNMVTNLVGRFSRTEARRLLSLSFAEFDRRGRRDARSLLDDFDDVRRLLEGRGFLEGWSLTQSGVVLRAVFHEQDILVAAALVSGTLDGLDPADLAAVCSVFVHEPRRDDPERVVVPSKRLGERFRSILELHASIALDERRLGLPERRLPHAGMMEIILDWARGDELEDLLVTDGPSPGDFVRSTKQLIDLLRQIGPLLRAEGPGNAIDAIRRLDRGVVALSHRVGGADS